MRRQVPRWGARPLGGDRLHRAVLLSLLVVVAASACQVAPPARPADRTSTRPKAASPRPTASTATPASEAPVTLAARVRADFLTRSRLVGPDGASLVGPDGASVIGQNGATILAGTVRIDPSYALRVDAGRTATIAGHEVLVMRGADLDDGAGGNVVVNDAARLLSDNGLGLLSDNGLGLLSDNGLGLIANNGGGLIANNGGGLIANNGGGLISDNGLGVVGQNGASQPFSAAGAFSLRGRGLQQAAPAAPQAGTPAAGMRLFVVDLRDGRPVPLGLDAAGAPVHAIYTDARGRYVVALPPALRSNVVVVAQAPELRDPRLTLGLLAATGAAGAAAVLTEAEALATAQFRSLLVTQLDALVAKDTGGSLFPERFSAQIPEAVRARAESVVAELRTHYKAAGVPTMPAAERRRIIQAAADVVCAGVDFAAIEIDTAMTAYRGPGGPALPALAAFMTRLAEGAAARLAEDPAWFDGRPYMQEVNARRAAAGLPPLAIVRPADAPAFMLREYMSQVDQDAQEKGEPMLDDLGVSPADRLRLRGIIYGLYQAVGMAFIFDDEVKAAIFERLRSAAAEPGPPGR